MRNSSNQICQASNTKLRPQHAVLILRGCQYCQLFSTCARQQTVQVSLWLTYKGEIETAGQHSHSACFAVCQLQLLLDIGHCWPANTHSLVASAAAPASGLKTTTYVSAIGPSSRLSAYTVVRAPGQFGVLLPKMVLVVEHSLLHWSAREM